MLSLTSNTGTTVYAVDPGPFAAAMGSEFNVHEWLPKTNSLTLRLDREIGLGYFLLTKTDYLAIQNATHLTVTFGSVSHKVYIRDAVAIDVSSSMVVLIVEEEKAILTRYTIEDDYNVIDYNTFKDYNDFQVYEAPTQRTTSRWGTPYTWVGILTQISTLCGLSGWHDGNIPLQLPFNVCLGGLTAYEALNRIAECFCMGVTVRDGTIYFKRRIISFPTDFEFVESNVGPYLADEESPVSKIPTLTINHPSMYQTADNQFLRNKFHKSTFKTSQTTGGHRVNIACPYHPEIIGPGGDNTADINAVDTLIEEAFEDAYEYRVSRTYHGIYESDPLTRNCDALIYYDDGATSGTHYYNWPLSFPETPAAPDISQSVELFKWVVTYPYDPDNPTFGTVNILSSEGSVVYASGVQISSIYSLGDDLTTKDMGDTGYGIRIGLLRYTLGGGGGGDAQYTPFRLTSDLSPTFGATATATNTGTVGVGSPIVVTNRGRFRAFTGALGVAISMGGEWVIVFVEMPALQVLHTLRANPGSTSFDIKYGADPRETTAYLDTVVTPIALSPFPHTWIDGLDDDQVSNFYRLFGEDDDECILTWDDTASQYVLTAVLPQRQNEMYVILNADRPAGLDETVDCVLEAPHSHGAVPTDPFPVRDLYNVNINAKTGDRAFVRWSPRFQEYVFIAGTHQATKARALIASPGFAGSPLSFDVDTIVGYDGDSPIAPLTVMNRFNWTSGSTGNWVEIRYDPINDEWYAIQMECE